MSRENLCPSEFLSSSGKLFQEPMIFVGVGEKATGVTYEKSDILLNGQVPNGWVPNHALQGAIENYKNRLKASDDPAHEKGIRKLTYEIDNIYRCPITFQYLLHPMVASDGHTYEKDIILGVHCSLLDNKTPLSGVIVPNKNLEAAIQRYIAEDNQRKEELYKAGSMKLASLNLISQTTTHAPANQDATAFARSAVTTQRVAVAYPLVLGLLTLGMIVADAINLLSNDGVSDDEDDNNFLGDQPSNSRSYGGGGSYFINTVLGSFSLFFNGITLYNATMGFIRRISDSLFFSTSSNSHRSNSPLFNSQNSEGSLDEEDEYSSEDGDDGSRYPVPL